MSVRAYKTALMADACAYCGQVLDEGIHDDPGWHARPVIDHIVPRRRGGDDNWTNWTGACQECNVSKGARSLLGHLLRRRYADDIEYVEILIRYTCKAPQDRALVIRANQRIVDLKRRLAGVGV